MDQQAFFDRLFWPAYAVICLYLVSLSVFGWLTRAERRALEPPVRLFIAGATLRFLRFAFGYSATQSGNKPAALAAWLVRVLFLASAACVAFVFYVFFTGFFGRPSPI